jgi:hypothetical protein
MFVIVAMVVVVLAVFMFVCRGGVQRGAFRLDVRS